jgi:hypothetical protein
MFFLYRLILFIFSVSFNFVRMTGGLLCVSLAGRKNSSARRNNSGTLVRLALPEPSWQPRCCLHRTNPDRDSILVRTRVEVIANIWDLDLSLSNWFSIWIQQAILGKSLYQNAPLRRHHPVGFGRMTIWYRPSHMALRVQSTSAGLLKHFTLHWPPDPLGKKISQPFNSLDTIQRLQ